jgi:AcrR family transcriptional regulator
MARSLRCQDLSVQDKNRYHHGDLRNALLEAAERLVRERGAERVSLRGIARAAGVSHAAPYHHFVDLEDLLAAVAASGFIRLRNMMLERAVAATDANALGRLQEAGVAYVSFAAANSELYRLMFSARLRDSRDHPELTRASVAAYEALGKLLARMAEGEDTAMSDAGWGEAAQASWALVHGLAMLLIDGRLDVDSGTPAPVEALARDVTTVLGRGLRNLH